MEEAVGNKGAAHGALVAKGHGLVAGGIERFGECNCTAFLRRGECLGPCDGRRTIEGVERWPAQGPLRASDERQRWPI